MGDVKPTKKSLKQRLGLSSKNAAPRQKLAKKSLQQTGYQSLETTHDVRKADSRLEREYRKPSTTSAVLEYDDEDTVAPELLNIAPEDRYKYRHATATNRTRGHDLHKNVINKDTGERSDITEMLHALHYDETLDDVPEQVVEETPAIDPTRPRGEETLSKPSAEIWDLICTYLEPREAANLALTCKTVWYLLGQHPFDKLRLPSNKQQRIDFLLPMDEKFPNQLFCFPCASFHTRTHPGRETLKPTNVLNPLFICPNRTNDLIPPPRARLTCGRTLPFTFVQLVTRAWRFGPEYGIPVENLARRWKDPYSDWTHHTRYHIHKNGHLMVRVTSQVFARPGMTVAEKRMLLYSREDYTPYFSACAHWRDGLLMDLCKCALDHIPIPKFRAAALGGPKQPGPTIVSLCGNCQPMRRCPRCPTEYLIELKLVEDKSVPMSDHARFKQALILTRWSDVGPGISPQDKEWAAIQGERDDYDSVKEVGNRSVSSTFESAFGDFYPGQRLLSLNPKNRQEGEEGDKWY